MPTPRGWWRSTELVVPNTLHSERIFWYTLPGARQCLSVTTIKHLHALLQDRHLRLSLFDACCSNLDMGQAHSFHCTVWYLGKQHATLQHRCSMTLDTKDMHQCPHKVSWHDTHGQRSLLDARFATTHIGWLQYTTVPHWFTANEHDRCQLSYVQKLNIYAEFAFYSINPMDICESNWMWWVLTSPTM